MCRSLLLYSLECEVGIVDRVETLLLETAISILIVITAYTTVVSASATIRPSAASCEDCASEKGSEDAYPLHRPRDEVA